MPRFKSDYVFVDEHNRHKRLKGKPVLITIPHSFLSADYLVMRACNGCRKRKIKCDAATTNTWPCSACTRLKLVCVPPAIGQDGDFSSGQGPEGYPPNSLDTLNAPESSHSLSSYAIPQPYRDGVSPHGQTIPHYNDGVGSFPSYAPDPVSSQSSLYENRPPHSSYHPQQMFPVPHAQTIGTTEGVDLGDHEHSTAENLSEVLGELKIDETGIGKFTPFCYR